MDLLGERSAVGQLEMTMMEGLLKMLVILLVANAALRPDAFVTRMMMMT